MHFTPLVCQEQFFNQEYLFNKLLVPFDGTFNVLLNLKLVVHLLWYYYFGLSVQDQKGVG